MNLLGTIALATLCASPSAPAADRVLGLTRFTIHHTEATAGAAASLARTLEPERDALTRRLGRDWVGKTEVYLGESHAALAAMLPDGVAFPAWASTAADPAANTIVLDARVLQSDEGRARLRLELARLALGRLATSQWPHWFHEGFALLVAGEAPLASDLALYRAAVEPGVAIPFAALTTDWPVGQAESAIAHAQSQAFVEHLQARDGEAALRDLIGRVVDGAPFEDSFRVVFGVSLADEERAWRASLSARYGWVAWGGTAAVAALCAAVVFLAFHLRARARRRAEGVALEEQAQDAARRIAAAERARAESPPERDDEPRRPKPLLH